MRKFYQLKLTLLIISFLNIGTLANAQLAKGSLDFGLNGFYSSQSASYGFNSTPILDGKRQTSFFEGDISYLIKDNISVGLYMHIDYFKDEIFENLTNSNGGKENQYYMENTLAFGLAGNYYIPVQNRLTIQCSGRFAIGKYKIDFNTLDDNGDIVVYNPPSRSITILKLAVGLLYKPTDYSGLYLGVGRHNRIENYSSNNNSSIIYNESFSGTRIEIGMRFFFNVKESFTPAYKTEGWQPKS